MKPAQMARVSSARVAPRRKPLLRETSESSEAESNESLGARNTPWPGPDFKVGSILSGSVYLWACGESLLGESVSRVSRSQAAAAWIILMSQAVCYAGLWYASGNQPDQYFPENDSASETTADYSILAIAGAMYLILSIAAADVWCGCALIVEGRGSGFILFTQRRVFGMLLLTTFLMLVGASIRVLFYSAYEDVQLVIGAAAVLFIADVDEKAMAVLNNISGEWALFWVLESVGMSFGLAVLAVKVTGNTDAIDDHDQAHRCTTSTHGGCDIFTWDVIIAIQPTGVTALAFLLTSLISRPTSSLAGRAVLPRSRKWFVITLVMICWVAQAPLWLVLPDVSIWFDTCSIGCALILVMVCYQRELTRVNCSNLYRRGIPHGGRSFLWFGGSLISLRLILEIVLRSTSSGDMGVFYPAFRDCVGISDVLFAAFFLIFYLSLINGLQLVELRSVELDADVALAPFLKPMLLGWSLSEGMFAIRDWGFIHASKVEEIYPNSYPGFLAAAQLAWLTRHFIVGTFLWGEAAGARHVGYWTAATFIRTLVVHCVSTWIFAGLDKTVK